MKKLILGTIMSVALVLTGCKSIPTPAEIETASYAIGVSTAMVCNMTKISDNLYSYTCPAGFTKFVINDNGSFQTADLKHSGDGYIWKVGTTYTTNEYGNKSLPQGSAY